MDIKKTPKNKQTHKTKQNNKTKQNKTTKQKQYVTKNRKQKQIEKHINHL